MKLLVATGNPGKLGEVREILAGQAARAARGLPEPSAGADAGGAPEGPALELVSLAQLKLPEPAEDGATFEENAAIKARAAAVASGLWTLADDSGLCVDALGGAPGLRSARYAETEQARREKLLAAMGSAPASRRGAYFYCAVALCSPDGKRIFRAHGRVDGRIATSPRGSNGFGYDPLFVPAEVPTRTLAELPQEEKNRLSHRGRALERLAPLLARLAQEGDLPAQPA